MKSVRNVSMYIYYFTFIKFKLLIDKSATHLRVLNKIHTYIHTSIADAKGWLVQGGLFKIQRSLWLILFSLCKPAPSGIWTMNLWSSKWECRRLSYADPLLFQSFVAFISSRPKMSCKTSISCLQSPVDVFYIFLGGEWHGLVVSTEDCHSKGQGFTSRPVRLFWQ